MRCETCALNFSSITLVQRTETEGETETENMESVNLDKTFAVCKCRSRCGKVHSQKMAVICVCNLRVFRSVETRAPTGSHNPASEPAIREHTNCPCTASEQVDGLCSEQWRLAFALTLLEVLSTLHPVVEWLGKRPFGANEADVTGLQHLGQPIVELAQQRLDLRRSRQ